ncbi:MAG: ABC transporter permease [Bacillota bacterium]
MHHMIALYLEVWNSKRLIFDLAKNDFKTRYAGSYFGILWAFIQPVMTILVFWFVFSVGLRTGKVKDAPFLLWFSSGIIPWFFFSEALSNATNVFIEYSYLVKKVVFKISILPFIKIISSLFVHLFFIAFLLVLFVLYKYPLSLTAIQILYFTGCIVFFTVSLSFLTASIAPLFKDLTQMLAIILQFGMWMTPIMWNYAILPKNCRWLLGWNPMFYIVEGYRDALINKVWFWHYPSRFFCFWAILALFFFLGGWTFKRLKPHFADML